MLRKLFIFVLILVGLVGVGDWLLTTWAEGAMERHLKQEVGGGAHVEIDSWPVMTRAVLSESIDEISVELRNPTIESVKVDFLRIEVKGLSVDRVRIFRQQIDDIDMRNGTVTVVMTRENLASIAGVSPDALAGEAPDVSVEDGRLLIDQQDVAAFPAEILPCSAQGEVVNEAVQFTCSVDEVPGIVTRNLPR